MKLRVRFLRQQLLFLVACVLGFPTEGFGQASIKLSSGASHQGRILAVTPAGVEIQFGPNKATLPLQMITEVQMAAPAEFAAAQQAFATKDFNKALTAVLAVTERYKGLPTDWAQLATAMLGDIYVVTNDLAKAEAAYRDFQRLYPGAGSLQAEVGLARIAASKKDYAGAKKKLEPIAAAALKEKSLTRQNAFAYSQTFLVLGQVKESEGDAIGALEDYLRTVTLFYHDPSAVSAAQDRADTLRKDQKITVP